MSGTRGRPWLKGVAYVVAVVNVAAILVAWVLAIEISNRRTSSTQDLAAEAQGLFAAAGLTISSALAWMTGFYALVTNRIAAASQAQATAAADQVRALEAQLEEAARAREAIERPFVLIDFDAERLEQFAYIVVSNQGRTIARDVQFTFEPPLATTMDDTGYGVTSMQMFAQGIPMLIPGREIAALFDSAVHRDRTDLPHVYSVGITYTGEPDANGEARRYSDTAILDLGLFRNRLSVARHGLHEIAEHLDQLTDTVRRWESPGG